MMSNCIHHHMKQIQHIYRNVTLRKSYFGARRESLIAQMLNDEHDLEFTGGPLIALYCLIENGEVKDSVKKI
jgi:hypothetical protein